MPKNRRNRRIIRSAEAFRTARAGGSGPKDVIGIKSRLAAWPSGLRLEMAPADPESVSPPFGQEEAAIIASQSVSTV